MVRRPPQGPHATGAFVHDLLPFARTHQGSVRDSNEDAFIVAPDCGLYAVADGMGGHNGGEVASAIAVRTVADFVRASSRDATITWPFGLQRDMDLEANQLSNAVRLANRHIVAEATRRPELAGMGSTIVALLARGERAWIANIGDSRLYRWRQGALEQLTEDDSWAASMARAGASAETIRSHDLRHALTRALGSPGGLDVEVSEVDLKSDDILLLSTDGLHGVVGDDTLARALSSARADPETAADSLIQSALTAGGPDNVTVIVLGCRP